MIREMEQRTNAVTWHNINDVHEVGDVCIEVMSSGGRIC
jgi:hypothetical protein